MVDPNSRNILSLRTVVNDWIYGEGKKGIQINANETKVLVSILVVFFHHIDINDTYFHLKYHMKFQLETALIVDAVNHFSIGLNELMTAEDIETQPISCDDPTIWSSGLGLATFLKQVER